MRNVPIIPIGDDAQGKETSPDPHSEAPWQSGARLSSKAWWSGLHHAIADRADQFLKEAGFDRAPWLAVAFGAGILVWFGLAEAWQWLAAIATGLALAIGAVVLWPFNTAADEYRSHVRQAVIACGLVLSLGVAVIWARSEVAGTAAIKQPLVERIEGYVLEREDQPSQARVRLTLAARMTDAESSVAQAFKIRVNAPIATLAEAEAQGAVAEGAVVRMRVRLMPPASPMLPGAYDFARTAWFKGLAASGSVLGPVELVAAAPDNRGVRGLQRLLSEHVRSQVAGSAGTIAAAFASGDRGAIDQADDAAMRDAGLTHLLSISGLHVSALVAGAYLLAIKVLALWPALALRVRLPVVAAAAGALAGVGYTILTGAEVPTIRSCVAALLVLGALALGREPLSLRMVALAAGFVLVLWPESAIGPSFQMSFAAVIAIIAISTSAPARAFLAPRNEAWSLRIGRRVVMLFVTGLVIELALMPIVQFHFHRAGIYGSLANVFAIPLVTFIAMPMIALALLLDLAGWGAPCWWVVQQSLDLLLWIAHFTASQPGAVRLTAQMSGLAITLFIIGELWLALWRGRTRLAGLVPIAAAMGLVWAAQVPDVLISGDGRQVGIIITEDGERRLLSLRTGTSTYARDNLLELGGVAGEPIALEAAPQARCSSAFCVVVIERSGRIWRLLIARTRDRIEERALSAACARSDIVIADRYLPRSCRPRWLKADRRMLQQSGGLALDLANQRVTTVASSQGSHGWWRNGQGTSSAPGQAGQATPVHPVRLETTSSAQ